MHKNLSVCKTCDFFFLIVKYRKGDLLQETIIQIEVISDSSAAGIHTIYSF